MAKAEKVETTAEVTTGVVYILGNAAQPDFIKVGFTVDLAERVRDLERVGATPFPWDCVYASEVDNPGAWVRMVRDLFSGSKVSTCFFHAAVTEQVLEVLKLARGKEVSLSLGGGKKRTRTKAQEKNKKGRGRNFDFGTLGLETGTELEFAGEAEAVCRVTQVKPPRVEYAGEEMTLTVAAARVLGRESTKGVQGPLWWRYEGETLVARRKRLESTE